MEFLKETDMVAVRNVAIDLLYEEPYRDKYGLVVHPFLSDELNCVNGQVFNIFENASLLEEWQEKRAKLICTLNIDTLSCAVTTRCRLYFFEEIIPFLSKKDFSKLLGNSYTFGELGGILQSTTLEWFENADKESLMYESERCFYNSLPDEVVIYRGAKSKEGASGTSWSVDVDIAHKFARRFSTNGFVFKAKVKKSDILAYFDRREEAEVIVNPEKISEIELLKK